MKTMKQSLTWLMAVAMSLSLITTSSAENAARTGKVVRIKGDARFSTGKKVWEPLKVGAILSSGSVIQTAKDSFVDIVINEDASAGSFSLQAPKSSSAPSSAGAGAGSPATPTPDQDVVRVLEDSYLVVDSLSAKSTGGGNVTETLLDLKKGSIFGSVKKQAAASRFEVKIPNGVAGIRGTIFMISAAGNVSCLTGSVVAAFTGSSGNVATQVVGTGSQLDCNTGEMSPISPSSMGPMDNISGQLGGYSQNRGKGKGKGHGHGHDKDHGHDYVSNREPKK